MSIKIMSAIFDTEFRDLEMPEPDKDGKPRRAKASSMKLVLLALADHSDDEGMCYPGFVKLETKTGLSRQGLVDVLSALKHNGLLTVEKYSSKLGTNTYTLNLEAYPKLKGSSDIRLQVKSLDSSSQVTLPETVKSLDNNHHLTTNTSFGSNEPSVETMPIDWKLGHGLDVTNDELSSQENAKRKDIANLIGTGFGINSMRASNMAYAFMVARNITIPESKIKGQRKAIKEMLEMKVSPENVSSAVHELTKKGMTVTDLFSVVKTATDLANKPQINDGMKPL